MERSAHNRFGSLAQVRAWYAEELRATSPVNAEAVVRAFATVPRERFLGPGPWRIRSGGHFDGYRSTAGSDPRHVYHNVLVALDEAQQINNGQPSLWAYIFDQLDLAPGETVLHLGCGTGYYSAILAELVGVTGRVTALDYDLVRVHQARSTLAPWPQVTVVEADGARFEPGPQDVIVASAGATHPLPIWLAALRPGGRLAIPLTAAQRGGFMLGATRRNEPDRFAAKFLCEVGFTPFVGARDSEIETRLAAAIARGHSDLVCTLRLDPHVPDGSCWLHGKGFCLSMRPL
ncbi:MAG TPA: methyltransferase domain-containing protein [Acetobacteraceae bacterium]|jgi:protein-L-isoaspartate(D-aspartate) O-methyltransferase|nr:methyltransferase domain-containing protein [Acetobacteraceae bacterium]